MKKCVECGKLVNEFLTECPHCRTPLGAAPPLAETSDRVDPEAQWARNVSTVATTATAAAGAPLGEVAGFWIRFLAYMIDTALFWGPAVLVVLLLSFAALFQGGDPVRNEQLNLIITAVGYGVALVVWSVNNVYLQGTTGATLGKRVCRIMTLRADGTVLGVGATLGRELFKGTISGICMLGFLWQAFDHDGQTWHDKVVKSYVFYS